jgi:hypothetical protein
MKVPPEKPTTVDARLFTRGDGDVVLARGPPPL